MMRYICCVFLIWLISIPIQAQINFGDDIPDFDYANPHEYEIGGITISGVRYLDHNVLIMLSGLSVGDMIEIPGSDISDAIQKLWDQGFFEHISISASGIQDDMIFLNIEFKEKPRLSKYSFRGVKKAEAENLRDEVSLIRNDVVTDNVIMKTRNRVKQYFRDKGFLNAEVKISQLPDTAFANSVILYIDIDKNNKVKINEINIFGNENLPDNKIKRFLKSTKEKKIYRIFKSSKFIEDDFREDKISLIDKYNELGYRDAMFLNDSIYKHNDNTINLDIHIDEGNKYYIRSITWKGNTIHSDEALSNVLKMYKGDVYNKNLLQANLTFNPNGQDVSSVYLDDGYLFFQVTPVEISVKNDSVDLEIRLYEGKQARINKVAISGNTRTNDHVVIREVRTKPGQLFSRADIIRTTRELAQLRYFNPETLEPVPLPNPTDGTVDIEYKVEETSSDQFELSGGWGAGRLVGTIGLSFNNFSTRNIFKKNAWRPLPSGDGQKLSVRAQSNGRYYQAYNMSFTEPWLGGKKPNSFSVSLYHSVQSNGYDNDNPLRQAITINGVTVGLSKRVKWPDDFFVLSYGLSLQNYVLENYYSLFSFSDGYSNNLNAFFTLARNSIDQPIYPRGGSEVSLSLQVTPPYSWSIWSDKDYSDVSDQYRYKWIEYHKWKFRTSYYQSLAGNLVLSTRFRFAFLGYYNKDIGYSPFERYYVGGDGLSGYALDSRELVGLRGYANNTLTPRGPDGYIGATMYDKFTVELRYPVSLNPSATIYAQAFLEAGNAWLDFKEFNPFSLYRSAGFGVRIYLPMFGLLGLDWGFGLDEVPGLDDANGGQFHFSINQSID